MTREQLVAGLKAGEESAWRLFIQDYGRMIYAVATRLGLAGPERDDLFQEACLSVLESIHTLRHPRRLASWVYIVTYRLGIDAIRRRRPEAPVEDWAVLLESNPTAVIEPTALGDLERLEEIAQVLDCLAEMDQRCRSLLQALYLEEPRPTYEEISRHQGIPMGSIGPTRARCLEKLGNLLQDLSGEGAKPSSRRRGHPLSEAGVPPRVSRRRGRSGHDG
ncbi:MAG: sigma-70 family RNA polymerase sigma factor [Candidatus Eisenbacteria sp.]|nr:sigma-70 family RNA polymerase sigma factor [Candidatus Eisenbacteria bacterium]